jgi:hypothetical protein
MIILECNQGSQEWLNARSGVITASMFSEVRKVVGGLSEQQQVYVDALRNGSSADEAKEIAKYSAKPRMSEKLQKALDGEKVGDYSDSAKNYAFRLAIERISGELLDEGAFQTYAMKRGNELEPDARQEHERQAQVLVTKAGLVTTDDNRFGASADGLIDEDGGSEYKCLIDPSRIRDIWIDKDIAQFEDQVQGCLWLTGRKYWHFCLYCPALRIVDKQLFLHRVERDENYIEQLETELLAFDSFVDQCEAKLREPV